MRILNFRLQKHDHVKRPYPPFFVAKPPTTKCTTNLTKTPDPESIHHIRPSPSLPPCIIIHNHLRPGYLGPTHNPLHPHHALPIPTLRLPALNTHPRRSTSSSNPRHRSRSSSSLRSAHGLIPQFRDREEFSAYTHVADEGVWDAGCG